ncbi:hypothetical protein V5O48_003855 [Marasmius crinis-equi]|uniref:Gfd2/YDR514C-like C-terminal domain-containing protein n=1 Tax=Marasmius crinis-equi TaxID=585013 RepID=A0ABR3FRQ1_9AGAR
MSTSRLPSSACGDEEQPLLRPEKSRKASLMRQLTVLCYLRVLDPLNFTQIFPYVNQFLSDLNVSKDASKIALYSGIVESAFAFTQLLAIYPWASLSGTPYSPSPSERAVCMTGLPAHSTLNADRAGRKPVILSGVLGLTCATLLFGLSPNFGVMLAVRALAGAFSGNVSIIPTVLCDVTDATNQAFAFSLFSLWWPFGSIIGPLIGGSTSNPKFIPEAYRYRVFENHPYFLPCLIVATINLGGVILTYIYLQETIEKGNHNNDRPSFSAATKTLLSIPMFRTLCLSNFGLSFITVAFDVVFVLFCYSPIRQGGLGLSVQEIGYSLSSAGISGAISQAIILPILLKRFDPAKMYYICVNIWPVLFLALPCLNMMARCAFDPMDGTLRSSEYKALMWTGIVVLLGVAKVGMWPYLYDAMDMLNYRRSLTVCFQDQHVPSQAMQPGTYPWLSERAHAALHFPFASYWTDDRQAGMSTDFALVDPKGWEYDLHSVINMLVLSGLPTECLEQVYSAYIGHFQLHNVPWYDKSWGHLFSSFESFLSFSWPVIVVTDVHTGKAHIVTRLTSIGAFLKMIKTRFGETLPEACNIQQVTPFETTQRHLRHVHDYMTYRKLHNALPAAVVSARKQRIKAGEPRVIRELWESREHTFMAIDFEWNERNDRTILEWGYATIRCGPLDAKGLWPPIPDDNYRKGHFIVSEHADKIVNRHSPTYPWHYAFGDSQVISKTKLPQIIETIISSFASPDSETLPNNLVLVGHGISGDLVRLEEMKIKIPHNIYIIDTAVFERNLFSQGQRQVVRNPGSTLSLDNLLRTFTLQPSPDGRTSPLMLPLVQLHNAGNDAFMTLWALQMLLDPNGTRPPTVKRRRVNSNPMLATMSMPMSISMPMQIPMMRTGISNGGSLPTTPLRSSVYDLAGEFGQMQMGKKPSPRPGSRSPGGGHSPLTGGLTPDASVSRASRLSGFDWGSPNIHG